MVHVEDVQAKDAEIRVFQDILSGRDSKNGHVIDRQHGKVHGLCVLKRFADAKMHVIVDSNCQDLVAIVVEVRAIGERRQGGVRSG